MGMADDRIVDEVLLRLGQMDINLELAKLLIERVEEYSRQMGLSTVIAVCNSNGNTIAVHSMNNAFIASFDIAVKKAYTTVAVKMSTYELGKLALPGETFYGIDKADNGRIIILGGGIPLTVNGRIVGGLGVSGGTGEQDDQIARYGQATLEEILR